MTKNTLFKFFFLSMGNIKRFFLVNLIFIPPILIFIYTLIQLVPYLVRYIDTMNISVEKVVPEYEKLAIIVIAGRSNDGKVGRDEVYVFRREDFNSLRKYIFFSDSNGGSLDQLRENSLAYGTIPYYSKPFSLQGKTGDEVISLKVDSVKEGSIEILFYKVQNPIGKTRIYLYLLLLFVVFILIFGSFGGMSDYTQRLVFHEIKNLPYLFKAIKEYFFRSLGISLFILIIVGAITANIYFYIFIMSNDISVFIAALNFWMFVFFILILFWVYPILVLSRDDSIWKVMKKSLLVSFDNFLFTLRAIVFVIFLFLLSALTLFTIPGLAGTFSFLNTLLKEVSSRYSGIDTA